MSTIINVCIKIPVEAYQLSPYAWKHSQGITVIMTTVNISVTTLDCVCTAKKLITVVLYHWFLTPAKVGRGGGGHPLAVKQTERLQQRLLYDHVFRGKLTSHSLSFFLSLMLQEMEICSNLNAIIHLLHLFTVLAVFISSRCFCNIALCASWFFFFAVLLFQLHALCSLILSIYYLLGRCQGYCSSYWQTSCCRICMLHCLSIMMMPPVVQPGRLK